MWAHNHGHRLLVILCNVLTKNVSCAQMHCGALIVIQISFLVLTKKDLQNYDVI